MLLQEMQKYDIVTKNTVDAGQLIPTYLTK